MSFSNVPIKQTDNVNSAVHPTTSLADTHRYRKIPTITGISQISQLNKATNEHICTKKTECLLSCLLPEYCRQASLSNKDRHRVRQSVRLTGWLSVSRLITNFIYNLYEHCWIYWLLLLLLLLLYTLLPAIKIRTSTRSSSLHQWCNSNGQCTVDEKIKWKTVHNFSYFRKFQEMLLTFGLHAKAVGIKI